MSEAQLQEKIRAIVGIHYWNFTQLPEQVCMELDQLLITYERDEILSVMQRLLPDYEASAKKARANGAGSGTAAEMNMACEMRLRYLRDSIEYIEHHSA